MLRSKGSAVEVKPCREVRDAFPEIRRALLKQQSKFAPDAQVAIDRIFGELHTHPAAPQMPAISVVRAHPETARKAISSTKPSRREISERYEVNPQTRVQQQSRAGYFEWRWSECSWQSPRPGQVAI